MAASPSAARAISTNLERLVLGGLPSLVCLSSAMASCELAAGVQDTVLASCEPGEKRACSWNRGKLPGVMFNAIRVHTTVESENLRIPELASLVGRRVEVIVVLDEPEGVAGPDVSLIVESSGPKKRNLGSLRGLLHVPDDFDEPLPADVLRAFEGDE